MTNNATSPAFPPNAGWEHSEAKGLTKREYIATKLYAAMLQAWNSELSKAYREEVISDLHDQVGDGHTVAQAFAIVAVQDADVLLAELEKTSK